MKNFHAGKDAIAPFAAPPGECRGARDAYARRRQPFRGSGRGTAS